MNRVSRLTPAKAQCSAKDGVLSGIPCRALLADLRGRDENPTGGFA